MKHAYWFQHFFIFSLLKLMMHWLICSASWIMYACILSPQPGPDLVKVVNLETSGPAHQPHHLTSDCAFQTGIHARCKYLSLLLTLKLSNAMLLRNSTQIRCNENNFQFPIFQPHCSPLVYAHTHHSQGANIWGYLCSLCYSDAYFYLSARHYINRSGAGKPSNNSLPGR